MSSRDLNRKVWSRVPSFAALRTVLVLGGLNRLLGYKVIPSGILGKVNFLRRASGMIRRLVEGRIKVVGSSVKGRRGHVRVRLLGRYVKIDLVREGGNWKLDDVHWPALGGGKKSFKKSAGVVLRFL